MFASLIEGWRMGTSQLTKWGFLKIAKLIESLDRALIRRGNVNALLFALIGYIVILIFLCFFFGIQAGSILGISLAIGFLCVEREPEPKNNKPVEPVEFVEEEEELKVQ
jgi:hypothetical protein